MTFIKIPMSRVLQEAWQERLANKPTRAELIQIIQQIAVWREEATTELFKHELSLTDKELEIIVEHVPEYRQRTARLLARINDWAALQAAHWHGRG